MNNFGDFIFTDVFTEKLVWWLETTTITPLCFYGQPGNGKTSFANYISRVKGDTVMYRDCNEVKSSFSCMFQEITNYAHTYSVIKEEEDKVWDKVIVLDEFHNLTATKMDYFKVPFEEWTDTGIQIIVCCNTGIRMPISKTLTPALISRFELISFDTKISDRDELTIKVLNKFPELNEHTIHNLLPDFRKISRLEKLYKTDALAHYSNLSNSTPKSATNKTKVKGTDRVELEFEN